MQPVRVLLLLQRPEAWVNIASVWEAMRHSDSFSPVVWVLPYNYENPSVSAEKLTLMQELLQRDAVPFLEWDESVILHRDQFDAVIFNHPYDRERPEGLWFDHVRALVPVTVYIPYGLVMGGGNKNLRLQYCQPAQLHATAVVARSRYEKTLYQEYCPSGAGHVYVLGLPRFDRLISSTAAPFREDWTSAIKGRKVILWNAHFSFGKSHSQVSNFSTFDLLGPEIFEFAFSRRKDICLLWRPHPGLLPAVVREGLLTADQLPLLREELAQAGLVLDESPSHSGAFAASDALITDVGSFLLEYLVTGKPVLALINPEGEPLNQESKQLVRHFAVASAPGDVSTFLDSVIAGEADVRDLSGALANHLPLLDGRAGERVADFLKRLCQGGASEEAITCIPSPPPYIRKPLRPAALSSGNAELVPPLPPTLAQLVSALKSLREEKVREPKWRKLARRKLNQSRIVFGEAVKGSPRLMACIRSLRGVGKV
ncbi:hypothetical protein GCM10007421_04210 [Halopseudomonas oceani]|nr:CDP-glycerol glycerophosphotransferase family protein [Halopseudomonas oceani]GGE33571.1 hypothetical protein GCM10007421_04210 [Halopseudomonas oceani]